MGEFFIRRPVFAISIAIAITMLGVVSLLNLSIEQYPDITPPVVQVSASYPGADAMTVNNAVATPIAQGVMGVGNMLYMQTTSANDGSMNMQVTFDVGSSPDMNAIFTQNNVATVTSQLPKAVTQQGVVTRKSDTGFLMVYALSSDGRYDDEYLSNYASINLENRLLKINGVGQVSIMGAGEYAMRVWIKPDRLHYYGLSLNQVVNALEVQSAIYPAGKFGAEPTSKETIYTYTVTLPPQLSTVEEFEQIIISIDNAGNEIRLSDVADVELGGQSYNVRSLFGEKPSAMIVIYQAPGSNAVNVGRDVKNVVASIKDKLPDGVEMHTVVDATQSIEDGIRDIVKTLILALLLVVAIIYLFLQDWRATLIPLIAIPVSLIGTFMVFPLLGFSLNIVSLLGMVLAIGLVVDDAIVVVEAVQVGIENGHSPTEATIEAMRKVSSPIIATTVVLLAVFLPVSFMGGITGLLFQQFSITVAVSIVFSAFNALTLSPALATMLLREHKRSQKGFFAWFNRLTDRAIRRYDGFTSVIIGHTSRTAMFLVATILLMVGAWRFLPSGFLPDEDQGYLMVMVSTPDATSLSSTLAAMQHAEGVIAAHSYVEYSSMAAGFNMMANINSTSSGIIFVVLKDFSKRKLTSSQIAQQLTNELYMAVPEAMCYAFIPPSVPGLGTTSGVTFQVQDLEGRGAVYLKKYADMMIDSLQRQKLVSSATMQFTADIPQRRIDIRKRQAMSEGVELEDVYSALSTYLGGNYTGNFNRFGKLYQIYVQASADRRLGERSLDSYFVNNAKGESVPLSAFVEVKDTVGVEYITQFNQYESIAVTVSPAQGTSTGDVMKLIETTAKNIFPDDVGYAWSGISYQEAKASHSGALVYVLALVFVFLALSALYNSWGLPFAIVMSVPIAVVGALLAMLATHIFRETYVNNIYFQISLVMLIGLASKNAILVVEYANTIYQTTPSVSLAEAAMIAAKERVRPIIMTAFAFILGVLPLVFASGVYSVARNIMGVALIGGMLLATIVGIFLYPAAYLLVAKWGHVTRSVGVLVLIVAMSGSCAKPLNAPNIVTPEQYLYKDAVVEPDEELKGKWWQMYNNVELDSLVDFALEHNRDLAIAASRIEAAGYALSVARAEYLPSLNSVLQVGTGYTAKERNAYNFALQPTVSWNVSLFGALKHAEREAQANILSSEWSYRSVLLSLTKEVVESYFTYQQAVQSLSLAEQSLVLREEQLHLMTQLQQQGFSTKLDLNQVQSLVYVAQADVAKYRRSVIQSRLALTTLLGIMPLDEGPSYRELLVSELPAMMSVGVPSSILERRPDVMESYYELQASAARVGVARSNRFPTISLTGSGGLISSAARKFFADGYWEWSAAAGVTQPIFSFGKLKRNEQVARIEYEEAVKEYEQIVINAVKEVESALIAISTFNEQIARYEEYVTANKRISDLTRALYERGLNDYFDVISTFQTWYDSQITFVSILAQQYINYAELVMALGDGWQDLENDEK